MDNIVSLPEYRPSWRKPLGMLMILGIILVWTMIVASQSERISELHAALQVIIYVAAGIVWIFPVKPLLAWMETGRFNPKKD